MKLILRLFLLAGAAALAIWAWAGLFPAPQKIIATRLAKLAQCASFAPGEGNLKRLADAEKIGSLFAENAEVIVNVPGEGIRTFDHRDELRQAVLASRSLVKGLEVEFVDINVKPDPDRESATADATLKARVGTDKELVAQALRFTFKKTGGDWLITRVESVESLAR